MKIELIAFSVAAAVSGAAFLGAAPAFADDRPVALVGLRIIDGTGASPIEDGALVYRGDRIVAVGQRKTVALPEGCTVRPLPGATALPGLINAHVHSAYNEKHAALWASCGITTVRDLSCDRWQVESSIAFRDRARSDPRLCRIVSAGSLITVPWGYMAKSGIVVRSEADALAKVDKEIDQGGDFVKIILQEPSFPRFAALSPELAAAIVARSHSRGVPVTAHVGTSADLRTALDLGVDDIAHIASDELPQDLIDRMVALDICLEPTLTNWASASKAERSLVMDNFRRFVAAGGRVALGAEHIHTARNVGPFIGFPMAELQMMKEGGMEPMQIIVAMTGSAARACRLQGQIGTLEPGKLADILVLDGDPLADLAAFTRVRLVVHGGTVIRE